MKKYQHEKGQLPLPRKRKKILDELEKHYTDKDNVEKGPLLDSYFKSPEETRLALYQLNRLADKCLATKKAQTMIRTDESGGIPYKQIAMYKQFFSALEKVCEAYHVHISHDDIACAVAADALLRAQYRHQLDFAMELPFAYSDEDYFYDASKQEMYHADKSYKALLQFRESLMEEESKALNSDKGKEKLSLFIEDTFDDALFPLFFFCILFNKNIIAQYKADMDEDNKSDHVKSYYYLISEMQEQAFFYKTREDRDLVRSVNAMLLFAECLMMDNYTREEPIPIPKHSFADSKLAKTKGIDIPGPLEEKLFEMDYEEWSEDTSLHSEAPLNLYAFNECTHLLDWVFIVRARNTDLLDLEGMLFLKRLKIPYSDMQESIKKKVIEVLMDACLCMEGIIKSDKAYDEHMEFMRKASWEIIQDIRCFHPDRTKWMVLDEYPAQARTIKKTVYHMMYERYHKK